jgi:hypothetical protein
MLMHKSIVIVAVALLAAGCETTRDTDRDRTSTTRDRYSAADRERASADPLHRDTAQANSTLQFANSSPRRPAAGNSKSKVLSTRSIRT